MMAKTKAIHNHLSPKLAATIAWTEEEKSKTRKGGKKKKKREAVDEEEQPYQNAAIDAFDDAVDIKDPAARRAKTADPKATLRDTTTRPLRGMSSGNLAAVLGRTDLDITEHQGISPCDAVVGVGPPANIHGRNRALPCAGINLVRSSSWGGAQRRCHDCK